MPFVPGKTLHYLDTITKGYDITKEDIAVTTTHDTKDILGVICLVLPDLVTIDGTTTILEDTLDWYAQDKDDNVWYFGCILMVLAETVVEGFYKVKDSYLNSANESFIICLGYYLV